MGTHVHVDALENSRVGAERIREPNLVEGNRAPRLRTVIAVLGRLLNNGLKFLEPEGVIRGIDTLDNT